MKVLVLGGDGFCGWPTSLHLSDLGHDVTIVDNLSRREIDLELEVDSLTPIRPIGERRRVWQTLTGKEIGFVHLDLATEFDRFEALLRELRPDALVHFAEQRAAPYSMRSTAAKRYTVDNNVRATHNVLAAIVDSGLDVALVHLGTMGVYGYGWSGSAPIPEGYLTVKVPTPDGDIEREILHPANPGSVYHLTKTLDQLLFAFYCANDQLRITDLHQGIVWGTQTPQTVHGTGGQTRAFIHIRDTVRCVQIALENPPVRGDKPLVFNQVTEVHRVRELAELIAKLTGAEVAFLPNPRREAVENELNVSREKFLALGLNPIFLSEGLLEEVREVALRYKDRADPTKIIARSVWRQGMETSPDLMRS